jgi:hypothetical protein
MRNLVFTGRKFEFIESPDPEPFTEPKPRRPQRAAFGHRGMPHRMATFKPISDTGNGYKPGKLIDLGPDQCRWTIAEGVMCGKKCRYPYCEGHGGKRLT